MKVTIIIPTYNRPEHLEICLKSCLNQTIHPSKILIGDDSKDNRTETVVKRMKKNTNIPINYYHNSTSLGQRENIFRMISLVDTELICLIHDDDFLDSKAIELLLPPFEDPEVIITYGKQKIVDENGKINDEQTTALNKRFSRISELQGVQDDILIAALRQQIPNNGYLVKTEAAIDTTRVSHEEFGTACDFGFSMRLAELNLGKKAVFQDVFTAYYRVTETSIQRNNPLNESAYRSFKYVYSFPEAIKKKVEVKKWLTDKSPVAIGNALRLGHKTDARKWLFSPYHTPHIITPGGMKRILKLIFG